MKNEILYNKYKIFNNLNNDEIDLFIKKISTERYKKNQVVISEGDIGDSIIFLLSGEISITKALTLSISKSNNSNVVEKEFSRLTSEQYISLGENSLFNQNNKRTATIKTLSECELGFLNNKDLFSICEKNYKVGYKLLKNLNEIITQNLIKTNHQILRLTTAFSLLVDE